VFFSEPLAVCHGAGGRGQRSEVRGQRATNDTNLHELGEDRGQGATNVTNGHELGEDRGKRETSKDF